MSLDTVNPHRYKRITRRDCWHSVVTGLAAAHTAGLRPVKVNAVLQREINNDEAAPLLQFCRASGNQLRFIEQMPLDTQGDWNRARMVTAAEILGQLRAGFTLTPSPARRASEPAEQWPVEGGPDEVDVIASVTRPFCAACDRARLTADGQMRSCLFSQRETDLRRPLRAGARDDELASLWREDMWGKAAGHKVNTAGFVQPSRPMSSIGG